MALWWWLKSRHDSGLGFSSVSIVKKIPQTLKSRAIRLPLWLHGAVVLLFVFALSGPERLLKETVIPSEGIDIVLALDVSNSMAAEDFMVAGQRQNRLDCIKTVVEEFIKKRSRDQIGLVVFGSRAYTVCPLTLDHDWALTQLNRVKLGIVEDGTAIGSGISMALLRLSKSKAKSKIMILLTDGINNRGQIQPLQAAAAAQALGIKIYTIGAGTKGYAPYPVTNMFGQKVYQKVLIDIDENTLKEIASKTGGQYFRATDTESLIKIYQQIDQLEKSSIESRGYKEYEPLYGYVLALAFVIWLLAIMIKELWLKRIP